MNNQASIEIVSVSLHLGGHATASGYDRLSDYIINQKILPSTNAPLTQRCLAWALRSLTSDSGSQWYHRQDMLSEMRAAIQWFRRHGQIIHFLYGENSYRYLGCLKAISPRNYIVCTYHTPPERFSEVVRDHRHLDHVDAIIVLSTMQERFFANLIGSERVYHVPHGIDVDYYKPRARLRSTGDVVNCLFVGSHLRDLDTLAEAARLLRGNSRLVFTVVSRPVNRDKFDGMHNVTFRSSISDEELLALYQDSDLLVLPLLDCTANNTLLEAMACGLPVITTDLQGARDYVNEHCAVLVHKSEPRQLADAITRLFEDRNALRSMAESSRLRALDLRWEQVASRMMDTYRQIQTRPVR